MTGDSAVKRVDALAKTLFGWQRQLAARRLVYDRRLAKLKAWWEQITNHGQDEADIDGLIKELHQLIVAHDDELFPGEGKDKAKSFATTFAVVRSRTTPVEAAVTDQAEAVRLALRAGIFKQVGQVVRVRTVDLDKLQAWLAANPNHKYAKRLAALVSPAGTKKSLSIRPNDGYLTSYDPRRLTPNSTPLRG